LDLSGTSACTTETIINKEFHGFLLWQKIIIKGYCQAVILGHSLNLKLNFSLTNHNIILPIITTPICVGSFPTREWKFWCVLGL